MPEDRKIPPSEHREDLDSEQQESHVKTLKIYQETDEALKEAQVVISRSRLRLQEAKRKYEERLYGFDPN